MLPCKVIMIQTMKQQGKMFTILYYADCNLRKMIAFDKNKKVICNNKNNCGRRSIIYVFSSLIFSVQSMYMCYFQNYKKGSKNNDLIISWRKSCLAPSFSAWLFYEMLSQLLCPLNASLSATLLNEGAPVGPLPTSPSHWPAWVPFPLALHTGWVLFIYFHLDTLIVPQLSMMMIPLIPIIVGIKKLHGYNTLKWWCPSQSRPHYTITVAGLTTALIVFLQNTYMHILTKFWSNGLSSNRADPWESYLNQS